MQLAPAVANDGVVHVASAWQLLPSALPLAVSTQSPPRHRDFGSFGEFIGIIFPMLPAPNLHASWHEISKNYRRFYVKVAQTEGLSRSPIEVNQFALSQPVS